MRESHWAPLAQYQPEKNKSVLVFPDHLRRPAAARDVVGAQNRQRLSSHSPWCSFRWGQVYPPLLRCALTNSFLCCQMSAGCSACPCAITATHHSSRSSPPLAFFFSPQLNILEHEEGAVWWGTRGQTHLAPLLPPLTAAALDQSCRCSASAGGHAVSAPRQHNGSGPGGDPQML